MKLLGIECTDEKMEEANKILVETPERIKPPGRLMLSHKDIIVINIEDMEY